MLAVRLRGRPLVGWSWSFMISTVRLEGLDQIDWRFWEEHGITEDEAAP